MTKKILVALATILISAFVSLGQDYQVDEFDTDEGKLKITFIKHGSLMFEFNNQVIHVDPVMRMGDYNKLPDADVILVTHHHGDHFDINAINELQKEGTVIVATQICKNISEEIGPMVIMDNNNENNIKGIDIQAIPAYNIKHKRESGEPFHPKGEGNGYILTFENKKVYIAGDTENIPEMKSLKGIDIAFLPMNLPYTMTPEMVADAAKTFKPLILYPYHYGNTDTTKLVELMKETESVEVKIRDM